MQAAQAVESRNLIAFREGGVVEDCIDEIIHGAAKDHDRLADVDQFAGALADDVYAQHLARIAMKDELEPPGSIAGNLPARAFPVISHAYFVGHILVGQLLLGLADKADLRDGIDAVGIKAGIGSGGDRKSTRLNSS